MDVNKMMAATTVDHEFFDGTTVKCTLNMFRLKQLASKNKSLYATAMKVLSKGTEDIFESVRAVYAAYVCANMDSEELMSEEDFMLMCGSDYAGLSMTISALTNPKKRRVSGEPSA